jgi:hypothetical protein
MFNWTKNFYKKDYSIPLTMFLVFVVYWFVKTAVKHSAATPFVWSKGIYDEIFSIAFVFIFFRVVFLKTKSIQQFIFYQHSFLWFLTKIIWFVSIVWLWIFLSFEIPKITTNIIYKATDLPVYVIDPCSYWTEELDRYANWTKEEESEALKFWRIDDVWGFDSKCAPREFERDAQY